MIVEGKTVFGIAVHGPVVEVDGTIVE